MAEAVIATVLGAAAGSFANVAIWRLPRDESLAWPPSHCPHCNRPIRPWDNIPIVSFLLLRARCRDCGQPISWRYPLVEALTALLFLGVWRTFGLSLDAVRAALFALAMVIVIFIDLDHHIIPDAITLPGVALGLLLALGSGVPALLRAWPQGTLPAVWIGVQPFLGAFLTALGAWLLFVGIAEASLFVLKEAGMGYGDVKLAAMMGAFLGWPSIAAALFAAFTLGGVIAIGLLAARRKGRRDPVPFGPFLALGALVALFWGERLIRWYLGLGR